MTLQLQEYLQACNTFIAIFPAARFTLLAFRTSTEPLPWFFRLLSLSLDLPFFANFSGSLG